MAKPLFNTSINIIGSISDLELIFNVLQENLNKKNKAEIKDHLSSSSPILIRTQSSKTRIINGILEGFGNTSNPEHSVLMSSLFAKVNLKQLKTFALFLQLSVNNYLFFLITKNVFIPTLRSGRLTITSEDVEAYLRDLRTSKTLIKKWTDSTINTIAIKYFTLMKKFGFIKGKKVKEFIPYSPNQETIIFFIYFIKSISQNSNDIYLSNFIDCIMISKEALIFTLKGIWTKEFFDIATTGSNLQVNLKFKFSEIIDELSKRH